MCYSDIFSKLLVLWVSFTTVHCTSDIKVAHYGMAYRRLLPFKSFKHSQSLPCRPAGNGTSIRSTHSITDNQIWIPKLWGQIDVPISQLQKPGSSRLQSHPSNHPAWTEKHTKIGSTAWTTARKSKQLGKSDQHGAHQRSFRVTVRAGRGHQRMVARLSGCVTVERKVFMEVSPFRNSQKILYNTIH